MSRFTRVVGELGPAAWWRFSESAGDFADSSGNGHTLTAVGSPTYGAAGVLPGGDRAVQLDATGDRATHVNHADFVTAAFTACGWLKLANSGNVRYAWQRVDGANGINVRFLATDVLNINGTDLSASLSGTTAVTDGQWWFWAVTVQSGAQRLYLYDLSGDAWTLEASGSATFTPTATASLVLSSAGQAAPGTVDEWCWFSRILTETELQTIAAAATSTVAVEAAFGATFQTASPTWTDLTDYVLSATARRGRSRKQSGVEPGSLAVTLANTDDRFTPTNTSSPYSPDVVPGVPIRVRRRIGMTWTDIARGYAEAWRPNWTGRPATCEVACGDVLREAEIAGIAPVYMSAVLADSPTWFWTFDQWSGQNSDICEDSSGNGYASDAGGGWDIWSGVAGLIIGDAGKAVDGAANSGGGGLVQSNSAARISGTEGFTVECVISRDGADWSSGTWTIFAESSDVTNGVCLFYAGADSIWFQANGHYLEETGVITDDLPHHVCVTRNGATKKIYIDGVEVSTYTGTVQSVPVATAYVGRATTASYSTSFRTGTLDNIAVYRGVVLDAATVAAHAAAAFGLPEQLPGERVVSVLDAIGVPSVTADSGAASLVPRGGVTAAADVDAAVVADSGIVSQQGSGTVRYVTGLRMPPTPRVAPTVARCHGYWTLDETSGTTISDDRLATWDQWAPAFNGTISGGYTLGQGTLLPCYPDGKSIDFNGTSGYIAVADAASFDLAGSIFNQVCCGAWIRPDTVSATRGIIARSDASAVDWALYVNSSGKVVFEIVNTGATTRTVTGATTLTAATVHQVMGVWDGTYLRVFVDGVQDGISSSYAGDTLRTSSRAIWIGRRTTSYFDGRLAHVWWGMLGPPDWDELADGLWRVGQPDWTFDLTGGLGYAAAAAVFDDEDLVRTVRVLPTRPSGTMAPYELSNGNARGSVVDIDHGSYDPVDVGGAAVFSWTKAAVTLERFGEARLTVTGIDMPTALDMLDLESPAAAVDIGDRVLVTHVTPGGVAINAAGWVTGVEHQVGVDGMWVVRLQIEP